MLNTSLAIWLKLARGNFDTAFLGLLATASERVQLRWTPKFPVFRVSSVSMEFGHDSVLDRLDAKEVVIADHLST